MLTSEMKGNKSFVLEKMYRCPKCHASVARREVSSDFYCTNNSCCYQKGFVSLNQQPVLVNFEKSIFDENTYANLANGSVLNRNRSMAQQVLYKIMWGRGKDTESNLLEFVRKVKSQVGNPTILVVGGGKIGAGIHALYQDPEINLVGFDVYCSDVTDFVADAHDIPLQDACVDGVWIQSVLEHVLEPERVVAEIHRVLRSSGVVYAETPFLQHIHERAYDYTRFTESGHRWLFRDFELVSSGIAGGPGTALVWSMRGFIAALFRSKMIGKASVLLFFWLRFFDYVMPRDYSSDHASGVFFMGLKVDRQLAPSEIIEFYRGV